MQWHAHLSFANADWYLLVFMPEANSLAKNLISIWIEFTLPRLFVSGMLTLFGAVSFYRLGRSEGREAGVADRQDRKSG